MRLVGMHPNFVKIQVVEAVLSWTGGQPFITQKLCQLIIDSKEPLPKGIKVQWLEKFV